jgi:hypothetical protein
MKGLVRNLWKILVVMLVLGYLIGCRDSDVATTKKTTPQKSNTPEAKEINWELSPEEQNLKVGDLITVEGWQDTFIAASWNLQTKTLESTESGNIFLYPTPTGKRTASFRITAIMAEVNPPRSNNNTIIRINRTLLQKKETSGWNAAIKIRVTAKISLIQSEPRYQNSWFLMCSGTDADVEY